MVERNTSASGLNVLLVEASAEQEDVLVNLMPDWNWFMAGADWILPNGAPPTDSDIDAVLVFAEKKQEEYILGLCQAIRKHEDMKDILLFVVIDQYKMDLGNKVRKLPKANFLLTPIEKEELVNKMAEMGGSKEQKQPMGSHRVL